MNPTFAALLRVAKAGSTPPEPSRSAWTLRSLATTPAPTPTLYGPPQPILTLPACLDVHSEGLGDLLPNVCARDRGHAGPHCIESYDEVEQHIGGAYSDNIARFIADRERLAKVDLWDTGVLQGHQNQFERNAASFFQGHSTCRVGVKDQYGKWHDFPGAHLPEEARPEKAQMSATEEFEAKYPRCCPNCGWVLSCHGRSQYGQDCPWGVSPAARAGDLPRQREREDRA